MQRRVETLIRNFGITTFETPPAVVMRPGNGQEENEADSVILEFAGLYNAGLKLGVDMF
jgi:hypothetical protein